MLNIHSWTWFLNLSYWSDNQIISTWTHFFIEREKMHSHFESKMSFWETNTSVTAGGKDTCNCACGCSPYGTNPGQWRVSTHVCTMKYKTGMRTLSNCSHFNLSFLQQTLYSHQGDHSIMNQGTEAIFTPRRPQYSEPGNSRSWRLTPKPCYSCATHSCATHTETYLITRKQLDMLPTAK